MKKSDLKTGMIVVLRDKLKAIIMLDVYIYGVSHDKLFFINEGTHSDLGNYNNDLTFDNNRMNDIIKVYNLGHSNVIKNLTVLEDYLLWERKEEKKILTLDGIEYSESTLRSIIKKATN